MSNVHEIIATGSMPFDITTRAAAEPRVLSFLAAMSGPSFGIGIEFGLCETFVSNEQGGSSIEYVPRERFVPNEHGGRTAIFDFEISGQEAVSGKGMIEIFKAMRRLGVSFEKAIVRDMENNERPQNRAVKINAEKPLSMKEIEERVSAYWRKVVG